MKTERRMTGTTAKTALRGFLVGTAGALLALLGAEAAAAPAADLSLRLQGLKLERLDPQLVSLLKLADGTEAREIDVLVEAPRLKPSALPSTVTTRATTAPGKPAVLTHDGRTITEAELAAHASTVRQQILVGLKKQVAARRAKVDEAIRLLAKPGAVVSRDSNGFRLRLPQNQLGAALKRLGPSVRAAALARPVQVHNDMNDVEKAIGVAQFALAAPYGMTGHGVGILHIEGYAPYSKRADLAGADIRFLGSELWQPVTDQGACHEDSECCSNKCNLGNKPLGTCKASGATKATCANCWKTPANAAALCASDIRGQEHSTMVALMLHTTAPKATEYHLAPPAGCMTYPDALLKTNPHILVGSQSWGYLNLKLDECEAEWDDFVVASRLAHFHSAGNDSTVEVGFPARAYNVMAVGAFDPADDTLWSHSTYKNPPNGVEKPEILAPGANVPLAAGWSRSGTSISAPIAAGFAADMMSGSAFFQNNPQAIKAYLIAGAHSAAGQSGFESSAGAKDGAGRINYLDTYYNRWGKIWSHGGNKTWFGSGEKLIEHAKLEKNGHYTIAISWLADGAYARDHQALNMKMKLTLSRGSKKFEAYQEKNNFQLLDVVVPEAGDWTITIERTFNSGDGGVDLALTVGKHS